MYTPLRTFTAQIDGTTVQVSVYANRIEWVRGSAAQVVPVAEFGTVLSKRRGLTGAVVSVFAEGTAFDFRLARAEAPAVAELLRALAAGSHPAQRPAPLIPPFPAVVTPGGAMIPSQSTVVDVPDRAEGNVSR